MEPAAHLSSGALSASAPLASQDGVGLLHPTARPRSGGSSRDQSKSSIMSLRVTGSIANAIYFEARLRVGVGASVASWRPSLSARHLSATYGIFRGHPSVNRGMPPRKMHQTSLIHRFRAIPCESEVKSSPSPFSDNRQVHFDQPVSPRDERRTARGVRADERLVLKDALTAALPWTIGCSTRIFRPTETALQWLAP